MRAGQEHVGRAAGKEKEKTIKMLSILTVTWLKKEILQYNRPKETQDVERKAGLQPFAYLFIIIHHSADNFNRLSVNLVNIIQRAVISLFYKSE